MVELTVEQPATIVDGTNNPDAMKQKHCRCKPKKGPWKKRLKGPGFSISPDLLNAMKKPSGPPPGLKPR